MNGQRKKYLIYGFFGGWNSGDEAILQSVTEMLRRDGGDPEIIALCTRVDPACREKYRERGIDALSVKEFSRINTLLKDHRLLIGGGQMITGDHRYRGLVYLLWLTTTAALSQGPARFIGAGVEGVHRPFAKWLCRRIVARCEWFGCRDEYSRSMLLDAGCAAQKIRLTSDVVLSGVIAGDGEDRDSDNQATEGIQSRERPISLGLHRSPLRSYADIETYHQLIKTLLKRHPDQQVRVVSNDSRSKFDDGLLEELQERCLSPRVSFVPFRCVETTISSYATASCVVSVRMHPLILGLVHSVPVLGIRRSNKVEQLSNMSGFPLCDPEVDSEDDILEKVELAIESGPNNMETLRQKAWQNFEGLH